MKVIATLKENDHSFKAICKEAYVATGGGTEEAYARGYVEGQAEGYTEGQAEGYAKRENDWWEMLIPKEGFENGGYLFASSRWNDDTYNPPHAIKCSNANQMFYNNPVLTDTKVPIEVTGSLGTTFRYSKLKRINRIIIYENVKMDYAFNNMSQLEEVYFEGIIGQNVINFQSASKLTHDSIVSIMVATSTTATITITFSLVAVNNAFETSEGAADGSTSEEWLNLVATRPNVTVELA